MATALQVGGTSRWETGKDDSVVTVTVGEDQVAPTHTSQTLADTADSHRADRR